MKNSKNWKILKRFPQTYIIICNEIYVKVDYNVIPKHITKMFKILSKVVIYREENTTKNV